MLSDCWSTYSTCIYCYIIFYMHMYNLHLWFAIHLCQSVCWCWELLSWWSSSAGRGLHPLASWTTPSWICRDTDKAAAAGTVHMCLSGNSKISISQTSKWFWMLQILFTACMVWRNVFECSEQSQFSMSMCSRESCFLSHWLAGSTVGRNVHLQSLRIFLSIQCQSSLSHVSLLWGGLSFRHCA